MSNQIEQKHWTVAFTDGKGQFYCTHCKAEREMDDKGSSLKRIESPIPQGLVCSGCHTSHGGNHQALKGPRFKNATQAASEGLRLKSTD